MRNGAILSGSMHGIALLAVILGLDWLRAEDEIPFRITEVSLIDGDEFEALITAAAEPESDTPLQSEPEPEPKPEPEPEPEPEESETDPTPPPPVDIPTEAPRPSIAELPSPDVLPDQAPRPESKPATVFEQAASPDRPSPDPTPRPQPSPETAPEQTEEPISKPEEVAQTSAETAEALPEAPRSAAPQEARLPVAKPADKARAAIAARKVKLAPVKKADEEKVAENETTDAEPDDGDSKPLSLREKSALQIGIKEFFKGIDNQDRNIWVEIEISLDRAGKIVGKPIRLDGGGGSESRLAALFRSGTRALADAEKKGVFAKLPPDKYDAWKLMHVRFTPFEIGFDS